ncbi:hypothetical protein [Micromonospora cathayae]|uniref:EcsC protein family protein n=1 Tax=Micromonospora cathayae TaxID=3028804 RepID=A0ABY7ZSU9_9ACTN|nr:hypothetical protein [Micromonospora sp. HUAS 3]WDZ85876.1 hypothetical protein PVK37_05430 [Micromonospora sp. HUAS 3]
MTSSTTSTTTGPAGANATPADTNPANATPATIAPANTNPADDTPERIPRKAATKRATPAKKAPAKKAAAVPKRAARTTTTAEPAVPAPAAAPPQAVTPAAATTGRTVDLDRLLADPGFAPELLALAAVERIGPQARAWAEGLRATYPQATPDGLARLATRQFVRLAGVGGATAALAGLFAPLAELATVLWTQSALVLHLAAAHGRDPADPERAVELLVLTRVHPDADSARTALTAARSADGSGEPAWDRVVEAAWRLAAPLAAQAGGWLALRVASRLLPGAAVLVTAAGDSAAAQRLAARAVTSYRRPTD